MSRPRPITLQGIRIAGYQGVSEASPMTLTGFGHRNVFIGQNDAGKSIPFRFLLLFRQLFRGQTDLMYHGAPGQVLSDVFWNKSKSVNLWVDLSFSPLTDDVPKEQLTPVPFTMVHEGKWTIRTTMTFRSESQSSPEVDITPLVFCNGEWKVLSTTVVGDRSKKQYLVSHSAYGDSDQVAKGMTREYAVAMKEWLEGCCFFDPLRSLQRGGQGGTDIEDGSKLVGEMKTMRDNDATSGDYDRWTGDVMKKLSKLFAPAFVAVDIRNQNPELFLRKGGADSTLTAVKNMGTGVHQMVIINSRLVKDRNQPRTYFLEEPETNLHPRLLRTFFTDLAQYKNIQFFITTHSNVLLDSLSKEDRAYHFSQDKEGNCTAAAALNIIKRHDILDALGVNGSTLLQANCVVWVEGPSDRLYIRRWLTEYAVGKKSEVREGVDYSFVFYGGSILSHFEFEASEEEVSELISLLSVSRYSAVIMDRNGSLTRHQERILAEGEADKTHRFVRHTDGREIENDLKQEVLFDGVSAYLGVDRGLLNGVTLIGKERYPKEIAAAICQGGPAQDSVDTKLGRKVNLAKIVLGIASEKELSIGYPSYIPDLFDFIVRSRLAC